MEAEKVEVGEYLLPSERQSRWSSTSWSVYYWRQSRWRGESGAWHSSPLFTSNRNIPEGAFLLKNLKFNFAIFFD